MRFLLPALQAIVACHLKYFGLFQAQIAMHYFILASLMPVCCRASGQIDRLQNPITSIQEIGFQVHLE